MRPCKCSIINQHPALNIKSGCYKAPVSNVIPLLYFCCSALTSQSTDAGVAISQVKTAEYLLKSFPHFLTPEGIDQWINDRIAHDKNQVHVKVGHEAHAVDLPWTGYHQDEMEEEGSPAEDEDPQQNGQCDGALHACPLTDGVATGESSNALDMRARQHEHVAVKGCHDEQHAEEHGHKADDDRGGIGVDDEDYPAACAEGPDSSNDAASSPHCHDVVVPQCIEDGNVSVDNENITFMLLLIWEVRLFSTETVGLHHYAVAALDFYPWGGQGYLRDPQNKNLDIRYQQSTSFLD